MLQPDDSPQFPARHDSYAALRSANYRRFASGFLFSATGLQILGTAIGWEIYERTDSALHLGYIGLARALPVVLFSLPAGHIVDLHDRKKILVFTQFSFALLTGLLAVASWASAPLWLMYVLLALTGCTRSFNGPSRASLLPAIVEPGTFHNAVTWNSGVFQLAAVCGPLLAGTLIVLFKAAWPAYACCSLGCLAFACSAVFITPREAPVSSTPSRDKYSFRAMFSGLQHLWTEKTILAAITLDLFAVLFGGATALMPVYAKDILHIGPVGLGWLRSMPYIGAFVMSLYLAHRPPMKHAGPALLWSVAGFGAFTVVFGFSTDVVLSLFCLFALGAIDNISVVIRHVLVQVRTPNELRGRVSAVNSLFIECSNELGAFESGLVARFFGPVVSVVSGGIGTLLVVAAVALALPPIRKLGELGEPEEKSAK